jgi:hypothetical protein
VFWPKPALISVKSTRYSDLFLNRHRIFENENILRIFLGSFGCGNRHGEPSAKGGG